jgi:hypothetical protein
MQDPNKKVVNFRLENEYITGLDLLTGTYNKPNRTAVLRELIREKLQENKLENCLKTGWKNGGK